MSQPESSRLSAVEQEAFLREVSMANLHRMLWLLVTSTSLSLGFAIYNLLIEKRAEFAPWQILDIGGSLIFLTFFWLGLRARISPGWRWALSPLYFAFWLVLMNGYYFQSRPLYGETITYALGVIAPAVLIQMPPRIFLGLLIPNHLIFCAILLGTDGRRHGYLDPQLYASLLNGTLGIIIAIIAAWFLYVARREDFKKARLIFLHTVDSNRAASNLRAILENIPFQAWLKDANDKYLAVNREFASARGLSEEEIIGKSTRDLWPAEYAEAQIKEDRAVIRSGCRSYSEQSRTAKEGLKWYEIFKSPVIGDSGLCFGLVGLAREITARKEVEEKLMAADTAKSEFLATVSHEIRTPMNSVMGYAQLLREMPMNPMQREYIESINNSGQLLLTVINDILDFSKIEAGKIVLKAEPLKLRELFARTLSMFEPQAKEKGLSLQLVVADDVPEVALGDAHRIEQLLVNLLSNAVKFTSVGSVTLEVSIVNPSGAAAWDLALKVVDTGIGIGMEQMDRLFKPFSQIDSAIGRRYGGTGLGLVIAERLSKLMGGSITVQSEPGAGSRFVGYITLAAGEFGGGALPQANLDKSHETTDVSRCRVLVVEDNAINRRLVSTILSRWGIRTGVAESGVEAVEEVRSQEYDVILMDVQMPGMDGFETTRQIREWETAEKGRWRNHIIALTAFAMADDSARCYAAGMDDYLTKPVNPELLKKAISRGLATRQRVAD